MNFLKKESTDLKFKNNSDSFDSIPPPPQEISQSTQQENMSNEQINNYQSNSTNSQGVPEFPNDPFNTLQDTTQNNPEIGENYSKSNQESEHADFMPNFQENPESPQNYISENDRYDWKAEDPAYQKNNTQENPFEEAQDEMSLPDLPDIPNAAMKKSLGAHVQEQVPKEAPEKVTQENEQVVEQVAEEESIKPEPNNTPEKEQNEDASDELPKLEYLPETIEEKEQYVESHQFYETLQDIKAFKRGLKDAEQIMKDWSELDFKAKEESEKFIENIDMLQEELITIDSTLFEEK